jgi:hypothetical protein
MGRKSTSIKIDEDLWDDVKHHCIDVKLEISEYLEKLIRKDLRK